MGDRTQKFERFVHSPVYGVFGFGADPIDYAKRLMALSEENPADYELLHAITDRVSFVNRLRFEMGWGSGYGNNIYASAFSENLDALEIYLLCTCVDALANEQSLITYLEWIRQNPDEVQDALDSAEPVSLDSYVEVTEDLHKSYRESGVGLTRNFIEFFVNLPDFLKKAIADNLVLIEGGPWDKNARDRMKGWRKRRQDNRVRAIADFLYNIRRCEYTHLAYTHRAVRPGTWRRRAFAQREPLQRFIEGWHSVTIQKRITDTRGSFYKIKEGPLRARFTLYSRIDEGYLLRAILAISVLRRMLHYLPNERYLHELLRYYSALDAIYAFLYEMQQNRDYIDFLTTPDAIARDNWLFSLPVPPFSVCAGEQLLADYGGFVGSEEDVKHYLHWLRQLNDRITQFNTDHPQEGATRQERQRTLVDLSRRMYESQEASQLRCYHRWISTNLRRHVVDGYINYGHHRLKGALLGWSDVWQELRENIVGQPLCPVHPQYPHIRTLSQGVINDVIEVNEKGITLRSHRTHHERFISARTLEVWWDHLLAKHHASLASPPRTGHGRIVGAIMATCLPGKIKAIEGNAIRLVQ